MSVKEQWEPVHTKVFCINPDLYHIFLYFSQERLYNERTNFMYDSFPPIYYAGFEVGSGISGLKVLLANGLQFSLDLVTLPCFIADGNIAMLFKGVCSLHLFKCFQFIQPSRREWAESAWQFSSSSCIIPSVVLTNGYQRTKRCASSCSCYPLISWVIRALSKPIFVACEEQDDMPKGKPTSPYLSSTPVLPPLYCYSGNRATLRNA